MANSETLIDILDIVNISNGIVQIIVSEPDLEINLTDATGTDITGFDGSVLFDGFGLITLYPNKRFIIEQSRVNMGQIQNYIKRRTIQAIFLKRKLGEITDIS